MTSSGLNEELGKLQDTVDDLNSSEDIVLKLVCPALERRNDSKKVTICGGSYNPFHNGHRELIKKSVEYVDGRECIAFITLKHSLNKPLSGADYAQRLYMLKMEQERLPFMSIGLINDGFYRNWFHKLDDFHPMERFNYSCVFGSDLFSKVLDGNEEKDFPKIFSIDWLVADRSGKTKDDFSVPESAKPYLNKIHRIKPSNYVKYLSSSGLKNLLNKRDKSVLNYISKEQFDFIKSQNIYF